MEKNKQAISADLDKLARFKAEFIRVMREKCKSMDNPPVFWSLDWNDIDQIADIGESVAEDFIVRG